MRRLSPQSVLASTLCLVAVDGQGESALKNIHGDLSELHAEMEKYMRFLIEAVSAFKQAEPSPLLPSLRPTLPAAS